MRITTSPDKAQLESLIAEISSLIKNEKNLSQRSCSEIRQYLQKKNAHLFLDDNNILMGFLFQTKLSNELMELHGLFLKPAYRDKGYAAQIFTQVTKDTSTSYLGATFLPKIEALTKKHGFEKITFSTLSLREKINFMKQRIKLHRLREVFRHNNTGTLVLMKKS